MAYHQAYQQNTDSVGRFSRIVLAYKRHSGSWAWLLHRITGIGLTGYLFLHIYALSTITKGRVAFEEEMAMFQKPVFIVLEFILFIPVIYHALNGLRIVIVDLGQGARNHKAILRVVYVVAAVSTLVMAYLILGHLIIK